MGVRKEPRRLGLGRRAKERLVTKAGAELHVVRDTKSSRAMPCNVVAKLQIRNAAVNSQGTCLSNMNTLLEEQRILNGSVPIDLPRLNAVEVIGLVEVLGIDTEVLRRLGKRRLYLAAFVDAA